MPQSRQCMIAGMRIATWCVGGINSRLKYLCHWLGRRKPDVVALQKTFARSDQFPEEALPQAGHESVFYTRDGEFRNGRGVAVLSRKTLPMPRILQVEFPHNATPPQRPSVMLQSANATRRSIRMNPQRRNSTCSNHVCRSPVGRTSSTTILRVGHRLYTSHQSQNWRIHGPA